MKLNKESEKKKLRKKLEKDTKKFLNKGNTITQFPYLEQKKVRWQKS